MEPAELRAINRFGTARSSPGIDAVRATHLSAIGTPQLYVWSAAVNNAVGLATVLFFKLKFLSLFSFFNYKKATPMFNDGLVHRGASFGSITSLDIVEPGAGNMDTNCNRRSDHHMSCTVMMYHVEHGISRLLWIAVKVSNGTNGSFLG
jgi:hypothetical protein